MICADVLRGVVTESLPSSCPKVRKPALKLWRCQNSTADTRLAAMAPFASCAHNRPTPRRNRPPRSRRRRRPVQCRAAVPPTHPLLQSGDEIFKFSHRDLHLRTSHRCLSRGPPPRHRPAARSAAFSRTITYRSASGSLQSRASTNVERSTSFWIDA